MAFLLAGICLPSAGWAAPAANRTQCPAFLWIAYGPQIKEKDGSLTRRFYIKGLEGCQGGHLKLSAFYLSRRARGKGPGRCYPVNIKDKDGTPYLDINTGLFSRMELHVSAACGKRRYRAATVLFMFGKSEVVTTNPLPALASPPPLGPYIHLRPARQHYWMQTGQTYHFAYRGKAGGADAVQVMENGDLLGSLALGPQGGFSYTPPHDPKLDQAEPSASKQAVLLIDETTPQGGVASTFTLLLHRSRHGHLQLAPGLALVALVALGVLFCVIRKRRRSPFWR